MPAYEELLADYLWNDSYILSLVLLLLEEMGRAAFPVLEKATKHPDRQIAERAISFLQKHGKEIAGLPGEGGKR